MKGFILALALIASIVAGAQEPAKATVIFYRLKFGLYASLDRAPVWIDGKEAVNVGRNSYARAELVPGKHEFRSAAKDYPVAITAEPGRTYYFREDYYGPGGIVNHRILIAVTEETGEAQCRKTKPVKHDWILDPALIVEEKKK